MAGYQTHLAKPIDESELVAVVATLAGRTGRAAAAVGKKRARAMTVLGLLTETFNKWWADRIPQVAAALAYYTVFSIAPLLLVAIGIAGLVLGRDEARAQILVQASSLLGAPGAVAVAG